MSVAQILEQLAANAGRAPRARAALIGGTIAEASTVPAQIAADHERRALLARQQAIQDAQLGFQRNADARAAAADVRANKDQALQDAAAALDLKKQTVLRAGIAAGFGDATDPAKFDLAAATKTVTDAGFPDLALTLRDVHAKFQPTITQLDPTKNTYVNGVLTTPAAPKQMTPAEQAQREETERHNKEMERIAALNAGKAEAAQKETERHNRAMEKASDPFGGGGGPVGDDLLAKMSPEQKAQSQALVEGRRTLDARMASTPYGRTIIAGAYAIDPTFDQGNYNARAKARTDLVSPNGTGGKTIGALNTAIQHAGKLSDLIETLDNSNVPLVNAVVNPLRTATGSTKVTNFQTVAPQLAKEIERVWRGAGGTAGEIHDLIETIGSNKGKQQQREALQQFVELAKGKLDTLERQRDSALGPTVGKTIPILFEQNQPIINTIAQRASGALISVTDPLGGVHQFKTQAEADAFKKAAGIK